MRERKEGFVFCEVGREGNRWYGRCLEADIFTEGESREEVLRNLEEAVSLHFEHEAPPEGISEDMAQRMDRGLPFILHV